MLLARSDLRRLLVAVLLLLVASCSGGGCSSGCSACGTAPLPGGFPTNAALPNAASLRVTRPGLNFLQENLPTIAGKAIGGGTTGGVATFPIPKSSQSGATICSPTTPVPPQCEAEIDLGHAKLRIDSVTPDHVKLDGVLPVRIRDLPVAFSFFNAYVVAGDKTVAPGQNLCASALRGAPTFPYKEFPLNVDLPLVKETRAPRDGFTKVDVDNAVVDIAITQNDVEICDDTCGGACQFLTDAIKSLAFNSLIGGIKTQIKDALSSAFCTAPTPTVNPPCPTGSTPDNADLTQAKKCLFTGTTQCVPSLLGADGRMDLSAALASFSPGTQGGLDFVLAAAGDMNPAPGAAGVPAWTPRNPPVPAVDNNANGISLPMLGGTLPHPVTRCVEVVDNPPPQDIPVPAELLGDTITPWPAGTPGPHLGFAIAGRFLGHAMVSAYNSGLLCLGISTEQIGQINSGFLSLLAPSIKTLTYEQNPAAAAITTHPGLPPKVKVGGGTDIKTDPLLTIVLDKFGLDFYVFSVDRFVRILSYTADVTIPLNLQTGKDPTTNPNGGLLPVIGNLTVANASVSNTDLLFEQPAVIADAVTGLLSSIVGQFLGGGIKPIDLQGALKSAGLALDIPAGGIRKLTSGSDDFIGLFANLSVPAGAAREEADTRAVLLEKIVDPDAMSLTTAVRARFPRLRVRATGIASRPTEQTWWVDTGTHAAWTTATELLIDGDAMLLQGKHVLHVSSRVIGNMASEDTTPAEIPFVIDTLAPRVDAEREGRKVTVRASDYVSSADALRARRRVEGSAWTEWAPLADVATFEANEASAVDVEVVDEEGNVGRVSLPLRGRADSTLSAAGSGCGCRTAPGASGAMGSRGAFAFASALGLALVSGLRARRRRARAR